MGAHSAFLDHLQALAREFSVLEVCELLVITRNELERRGQRDAANYVTRAAHCFADELDTPEAPSDNGSRSPGENGADR